MNGLNEYLQEALKINKSLKYNKGNISGPEPATARLTTKDVEFPAVDPFETKVEDKVWRKLKMPTTEYIIYRDKYRGNRPHLATLEDMIMSMAYLQDDYEDFDPQKDIIYGADNLKDIVKWYVSFNGIQLPDELDEDYEDEFIEKWEALHGNNCPIDNGAIIFAFLMGWEDLDSFKWHSFTPQKTYKDFNSFKEMLENNM